MSTDIQLTALDLVGPRPSRSKDAIPSSVLGILIFIAAEVMFFASFVSAYMIISSQAENWPSPDLPRLPVEATALNSLFLIASAATMWFAYRNRSGSKCGPLIALTVLLGAVFVGAQGIEWAKLIAHGLKVNTDVYGSFFYAIIGAHAVHAIGALLALVRMFVHFKKGKLTTDSFLAHSIFWYFVVGIWPVLYVLVYL